MTKELLPGLGSGALREALWWSDMCGHAEFCSGNDKECRACQRLAALSLSSPIEPPPNARQFTPETLAKRFHELYEYLAPKFGYETRKASAVPWEQVPANNRQLMSTVCEHILKEIELIEWLRPTLKFGDGDYSCAVCGMGMKEPCEHWRIANLVAFHEKETDVWAEQLVKARECIAELESGAQASSEIRERIHALPVHKFGAAGDSWDDVEPTEYFRVSDVFEALAPSRQGAGGK